MEVVVLQAAFRDQEAVDQRLHFSYILMCSERRYDVKLKQTPSPCFNDGDRHSSVNYTKQNSPSISKTGKASVDTYTLTHRRQ